MRVKVGSMKIGDVVGKWDVDNVNENTQYLMDGSAGRRLFLANSFTHKLFHKHALSKSSKGSLTDYIVLALGWSRIWLMKGLRGEYLIILTTLFCNINIRMKRNGNINLKGKRKMTGRNWLLGNYMSVIPCIFIEGKLRNYWWEQEKEKKTIMERGVQDLMSVYSVSGYGIWIGRCI